MIEQYYQSLLDFLAACAIVQSFELGLDKRSSVLAFVRGDVYFADDSRLRFRELVDTRQLPVRDMYAYHYQSADGGLLFRYDTLLIIPTYPAFRITSIWRKDPRSFRAIHRTFSQSYARLRRSLFHRGKLATALLCGGGQR